MSYHRIYARQAQIVDFIRQSKKARVKDIVRFLSEIGEHVSHRTVERDLLAIQDNLDFGVERHGTHPDHWYAVETGESADNVVQACLRHAQLSHFFRSELRHRGSGNPVIYPDDPNITNGLVHLPLLAEAARNNRVVEFCHKKFGMPEEIRVVGALFLREFRKRWYLVARDLHFDQVRTFGLDRISWVHLKDVTFKPKPTETYEALFGHVIGLFESEARLVTIRFWSEEYQANYLRTLPLHPTQREVGETDDGHLFELDVAPNFELYQTFGSLLDRVRILSPKPVVDEMKEFLQKALNSYEA